MFKFRRNLHNFIAAPIWTGAAKSVNQFTFLLLGLIGLGLMLNACTEPVDDEARIRQRVAEMVTATEAKELGEVMDPVQEDFLGNKRIRKANLRGLVLIHFRRHKNVHVFVNDLEVVLNNDEAEVTCDVVMAGRNKTLPDNARVLQVKSAWKKIDDDWFVVSASWKDPFLN